MNAINPQGESNIDVLMCGLRGHMPRSPRSLRTPGRPPVTVILDREDDVRFTRTALRSHAPAAGRVVVHPTVPVSHKLLWHDNLRAPPEHRTNTRPPDVLPNGRAEHQAAYRAAWALHGCRITILRAHLITTALWADVIHLHRTTRVDVTLIHHADLNDDFRHLLNHCHHRVLDTFDAMRALHPLAPAAQP